jgi:hypothetical protein
MNGADFTMPDFGRLVWASDDVRERHAPVLNEIAAAWSEIQWRSVVAGLRRCAQLVVYAESYASHVEQARKRGLKAVALRVEEEANPRKPGSAPAHVLTLVVGKARDTAAFKSAWIRRDDAALGDLLGYPACCQGFFERLVADHHAADPTWFIAANTAGATREANTITVAGPPALNILLRYIGVRAIPHLPCRLDCADSEHAASDFLGLAGSLGFSAQAEAVLKILDWPAEWSALHGIAEIKTPVMKISTRTPRTPGKYIVRWLGGTVPSDGARGLAFPYRPNR